MKIACNKYLSTSTTFRLKKFTEKEIIHYY